MRRLGLLLSTSALICLSHSAFAADIPNRTPLRYTPAPAVTMPSWTGWYLGGNLGYGLGKARSDVDMPGFSVDSGVPAGIIDIPGSSKRDTLNLDGFVGGLQAGYNWQIAPAWLLGAEADFQRAGQKASAGTNRNFSDTLLVPDAGLNLGDCPCNVTGSNTGSYETDLRWFGTLRARAGYIWDRTVFYGTGGLAYGKFQINGHNRTEATVTDDNGATAFNDTLNSSFSKAKWKAGWTIGAGVEGLAWDPRWTWKAEYLYMDLGKLNTRAGAPGSEGMTISTKFTDHIGRLGLNYRF